MLIVSSASTNVLFVIVAAIWSPIRMSRAYDPSCLLSIVKTSPTIAVTLTISAFADQMGYGYEGGYDGGALMGDSDFYN